ncbi:MAG: hypothetical protein LBB88_01585 [Planctomycetaceae bacterium]|nr:hypothetical protein [Planctomycetaceae bacterium]
MPCVSLFDQKITDRDAKHCVSTIINSCYALATPDQVAYLIYYRLLTDNYYVK